MSAFRVRRRCRCERSAGRSVCALRGSLSPRSSRDGTATRSRRRRRCYQRPAVGQRRRRRPAPVDPALRRLSRLARTALTSTASQEWDSCGGPRVTTPIRRCDANLCHPSRPGNLHGANPHVSVIALVAQLDRASASGAEGHRFESCRARVRGGRWLRPRPLALVRPANYQLEPQDAPSRRWLVAGGCDSSDWRTACFHGPSCHTALSAGDTFSPAPSPLAPSWSRRRQP